MPNAMIQSQQLSLKGLIKKYNAIVIPILQRDYAQGRRGEEELRTNFIKQLKDFLKSDKPFNDLDFVYGNVENNPIRFIPIDGQQRLTTLFLMHYYLSIHDGAYNEFQLDFGKKLPDGTYEALFSYETRTSSIAFCNALLNYAVDLYNLDKSDLNTYGKSLNNELIKTIKNQGWFIASWLYDPTIDSMLRMLDCLHHYFKDEFGLYAKLVSDDAPAITFRELPMRDNGLNDDLYIKMNSRGLNLTRFEKIKAKIIQELKKSKEVRALSRSSVETEKNTPLSQYFAYKIDTTWSYMFWPYHYDTEYRLYSKKYNLEKTYTVKEIDSRLLNFIASVAANYQAVRLGSKNLDLKLLDEPSSSSWSSFSAMDATFFTHLIDVFDAFGRSYDAFGIIPYRSDLAIDIKELFGQFLKSEFKDRVYERRIRFYAYYSFIIFHKDNLGDPNSEREIYEWCRIITNLTINNRYDSEADFCNVISNVDLLLEKSSKCGILHLLASKEEIPLRGVDQRQFKEERIKAKVILTGGQKWYDVIKIAENNQYLTGQIISILFLSGLENLYDNYILGGEFTLNEEQLSIFKQYSNYIDELFNENGLKPEFEKEQLFRRALLSKGDYSMWANSNKSLLNNRSRDVSWKRYLHQSPENLKELQALLNPKISNLKEFFEAEIADISVVDLNDWRGMLVTTPAMWDRLNWQDVQSRRFIRFWGENFNRHIYPLKLQRMSGEHYEMRTLYRYFTLIQNKDLKDYIEAISSCSDEYEPHIKFGNGELQFRVYYHYQQEFPWRIEFLNEDELVIKDDELESEILKIIKNN